MVNKLRIRIYPDPILKKKAGVIAKIDGEVKKLTGKMIETMHDGDGVGLAGPQVGISKRIFVIDAGSGEPQVFVNPKISRKRGRQVDVEGCLSLPGLEAKVKRAKSLRCEYLDENGKEHKIDCEGLLARVLQHENDHLEGILFIDRIGFLRRRKLMRGYGG